MWSSMGYQRKSGNGRLNIFIIPRRILRGVILREDSKKKNYFIEWSMLC